jgi:hypothetical protein
MPTSSVLEILAAQPTTIKTPSGEVQVKEMPWGDLLQFLNLAAEHIGSFIKEESAPLPGFAAPNPKKFDISKIVPAIASIKVLSTDLIARSTGKDPAWIQEQSPRVILRLIQIAIELNVTEELLESVKATGAQFLRVTPLVAKQS